MSVAVVTGASRGLGLAVALALSQRGWNLVVDARNPAELTRAVEALPSPVVALPGDVTDPYHRAGLAAAAADLGGADLLVNNAGALGPSPLPALADLAEGDLIALFRANVSAPLALSQGLLPQLRARSGRVVNVTSDAAVEPYPGWGGYGCTKAALDLVTAVLAVEVPELRVYGFDPGDMRTRMHQDAYPGEDISDRPEPAAAVPALLRLVEEDLPSGRYRAADLRVGAVA